jgi:hypothetical protein
MNMLSRYLYAVYNDLPTKSTRDDIIAEIGEALQSQIDEREAQLGRPLSDDEEAALIEAYGHPRLVAAKYAAVPYLIGPELLPFYFYLLRTILTVVLAIEVAGGALIAIGYGSLSIFTDALGVALRSAIVIFTILTIAFAAAERAQRRDGHAPWRAWDPRRLPAPDALPQISRAKLAWEFIANVITLLVLLAIPRLHLGLQIAIPQSRVDLLAQFNVAAWAPAYFAMIAGTVIVAVSDVAVYIRPAQALFYRWMRLAASTITIAGLAMTLARRPLLIPADNPFTLAAQCTLIAGIAILGIQLAVSLYKLFRQLQARAASPGSLKAGY